MPKPAPELAATARKLFPLGLIVAFALAGSAAGPIGSPAGAANRTELLFLGTAGGPPLRPDRSEPSTLLIVDGREYLIDCGVGTMRRMLEAGVHSDEIATIFLTHLHPDHALGLADVMENDFFQLRGGNSAQTIAIYGPPRTQQLVDAAFEYIAIAFGVFAAEPPSAYTKGANGKLLSPFNAHEVENGGVIFQDDKIRVTAAENTHYALMPAQARTRMKSYSYRIETPHGVVVFTGDTGPSDAVLRLAQGADVLVTEVEDLNQISEFVNRMAERNHWTAERTAALMAHMRREHLSEEEAGIMAAKAGVKSLVLYHYDPADPAAYVAAVKKMFPRPVFAPADLERYCLRSVPQGAYKSQTVLSLCGHASANASRVR
ncbi:MAG TPA: MBL fold metallo-hydrolase [Terriglobales bacterium]|nr:MBL fold metallo-hydrolase [Terriglobales bacterium]